MKSLVTGGAGFIGSHLVDELLSLGHEVIVIDNESSNSNSIFYWNNKADNYKYDICDYENTKNLYKNVDYVFHTAAKARIQATILDPIETIKTNSLGTTTVLQCSKEAKVKRVIYSSTSSAYGLNEIPNVETQPDNCLNFYSISKTNGEKICSNYSKIFNLETISLRYFNVYGERQPLKGQYATLIGLFNRQRESNEPLTIVGNGEQRRDFTHVSDVVRANILASQFIAPEYQIKNKDSVVEYTGWEWGQVYNIGTGVNHSINEIADMMGGEKINIPPRLGESRITLSDSTKAKEHLGWTPKVKLEDWIKENK